jgi:hypothetical protein
MDRLHAQGHNGSPKGKEKETMNYTDFDPYLAHERTKGMRREVHLLRLEKQLQQERGSGGARFVALLKRGVRPLLRVAHLAG